MNDDMGVALLYILIDVVGCVRRAISVIVMISLSVKYVCVCVCVLILLFEPLVFKVFHR